MAVLIIIFTGCHSTKDNHNQLNFTGAFALYPLNIKWSEAYKKSHPDIVFNIQPGGAGKGLTDVIAGNTDAGMFSKEISGNEISKGVWYIALAKDAVFATINTNNPYAALLKKRGLTKELLQQIFIDGKYATWEDALGVKGVEKAHKLNVYTRSDASGAAESWAAYFNSRQDKLKGIGMMGDPGIADAVKKDVNGIGFNNPQYLFDMQTGNKISGIDMLPLDVNTNGQIDSAENYYDILDDVEAAVRNGNYPSPPVRGLYFVCKQKPSNSNLISYFKWVLTDGQAYIKKAGYVALSDSIIQEQLKKLE